MAFRQPYLEGNTAFGVYVVGYIDFFVLVCYSKNSKLLI